MQVGVCQYQPIIKLRLGSLVGEKAEDREFVRHVDSLLRRSIVQSIPWTMASPAATWADHG